MALITACVIPPAPNKPVIVARSCVIQFTKSERDAARQCASENDIRWRFNRGR
jgi:hypothetical protein